MVRVMNSINALVTLCIMVQLVINPFAIPFETQILSYALLMVHAIPMHNAIAVKDILVLLVNMQCVQQVKLVCLAQVKVIVLLPIIALAMKVITVLIVTLRNVNCNLPYHQVHAMDMDNVYTRMNVNVCQVGQDIIVNILHVIPFHPIITMSAQVEVLVFGQIHAPIVAMVMLVWNVKFIMEAAVNHVALIC